MIQVLICLDEHQIVHRDIKTENILFDYNGVLKLADFGTAKLLSNGTSIENETFVGTPEFAAPEMLTKNKYDRKVDLWATGIVIFEVSLCVYG